MLFSLPPLLLERSLFRGELLNFQQGPGKGCPERKKKRGSEVGTEL